MGEVYSALVGVDRSKIKREPCLRLGAGQRRDLRNCASDNSESQGGQEAGGLRPLRGLPSISGIRMTVVERISFKIMSLGCEECSAPLRISKICTVH